VLQALLRHAAIDAETVGLFIGGSRGAGCADEESDYDLSWVLTAEGYNRRKDQDEPMSVKEWIDDAHLLDIGYTTVQELNQATEEPGWWTPGQATARVLLDKTGEITSALQAIATMPEDKAQADAAGWFDAYLNAFYRSMKAWRRGNELGARLLAAESAMHLVRTLFSLERRWPPYHDRLFLQLDLLDKQGWPPGYLHEALLNLVKTGDPALQQKLEARVEALMRERGFGGVVDDWGGEIERVRAFRFE
jgi:hypothetical protein